MASGFISAREFRVGIFVLFYILDSVQHSVVAQLRKLDMAPDAVDDIYMNCVAKVFDIVTKPDGLLKQEVKASQSFSEMWRKHKIECKKQIPGGTVNHMAALHAYANSAVTFRKEFNSMVYSKGKNSITYIEGFPFKSLHFLLMDSMRLMNPDCTTVHYGTTNKYTADVNKEIRFGKFISPQNKFNEAAEIVHSEGEGTVFNITSCSAVNLENYTCKSEEISGLISPTEVFKVVSIEEKDDEDTSYRLIKLTHSRFLSNQNCALLSSPGMASFLSSSPLLVFVLLALVCLHVVPV